MKTIRDLFAFAWKEHWNKERYLKSGWAREVERNFKNHIEPAFGAKPIDSLTPKKIRTWLKKFEDTPYAGNRSLEVLSKMLIIAEEEELIPVGAAATRVVKALPEKKRDRYASIDEIKKIMAALSREALSKPKEVIFLYLLMFTGSRPRAIERATWRDFSLLDYGGEAWGVLKFDGKSTAQTGRKEVVLLPPFVVQMLDLKAMIEQKDEPILGIKMPRALWERVRKEAGASDLWARDWRRTFATIAFSSGVGRDVVGELLNHSSQQTTMLYAKLADGARLEAAATVAKEIQALIRAS